MRECFRGWRRKIGVLTLMMALVFMGGWVRSFSIKDEISVRKNVGITTHLISNRSRLGWKSVTIDDPLSTNFTISFYFAKPAKEHDFYRGHDVRWKWRWQCCGFEFGRFIPNGPPWIEEIWIIPYWSLVIPLTALSAFLLLSKPRKSTQGISGPEKVQAWCRSHRVIEAGQAHDTEQIRT